MNRRAKRWMAGYGIFGRGMELPEWRGTAIRQALREREVSARTRATVEENVSRQD